MKVDGIAMTVIGDTGSVRLDGEFQVSSKTRIRYGTQVTSLKLQNQANSTVQSVELEMDTEDLLTILTIHRDGLTADDLRKFADIMDAN